MKIKIIIALLWLQVTSAQKAQELIGINGEIQRIEQFDYMSAQSINGKWHIDKNDQPLKTVKIFDRNGLLQSVGYVEDNAKINRVYYYDKGKMASIELLDSIGNLQHISLIDWPTKYTAVAIKLDKEGKCLHKQYWYYNNNFSLNKYIITSSCNNNNPDADLDTKAIYHYDANGFNNKKEISVQGYNYVVYYDILERDRYGNPSAIVESHIETGSNNEIKTLTLYRYTYFDEKPQNDIYNKVIFEEKAYNILARANEDTKQFEYEETQQELTEGDRAKTIASFSDETCINRNRYTAKQRLKFYPFNRAENVALISYRDAAVEAELYADKNKLPNLEQADKVVLLNSEDINDLTNTIYNIGYAEPVFVKTLAIECTAIKNAIVFLDGSGKPFEYILLYFGCNQYSYSSKKVEDGDYCNEKFSLLKQHFIAKSIPTAP
jgi:hypothetical protein